MTPEWGKKSYMLHDVVKNNVVYSTRWDHRLLGYEYALSFKKREELLKVILQSSRDSTPTTGPEAASTTFSKGGAIISFNKLGCH